MQIIEVIDTNTSNQFLRVNVLMNQHNPFYIQPLNKDINDIFDATKNKQHQHGEIKRWILKTNNGNLIGRIAAFTNKKYTNKVNALPIGGCGFFECINNQDAANILFDTAKKWLQSHLPINPTIYLGRQN